MKLLGVAPLVESVHESGKRVKSVDLGPFGGPSVFLGPVEQPIVTGTLDRGPLRLELPSRKVFQLASGDPPPTIGGRGFASGPLKWLPLFAGVAAFLWLQNLKVRR